MMDDSMIEDRERLIEHAAKGDEVGGAAAFRPRFRDARLHERNVDMRVGLRQPLEVLQGARRRDDFELDAVGGKERPVLLGEFLKRAALGPTAHGEHMRRQRPHEVQRQKDGDRAREQNRAQGVDEIPPGDAGDLERQTQLCAAAPVSAGGFGAGFPHARESSTAAATKPRLERRLLTMAC